MSNDNVSNKKDNNKAQKISEEGGSKEKSREERINVIINELNVLINDIKNSRQFTDVVVQSQALNLTQGAPLSQAIPSGEIPTQIQTTPTGQPLTQYPVTTTGQPPTQCPLTPTGQPPTHCPLTTTGQPPTQCPFTPTEPPPTQCPVTPTPPPPTQCPVTPTPPPPTQCPATPTSPPPTQCPVATTPPPPTQCPVATTPPPPTQCPVATTPPPPTQSNAALNAALAQAAQTLTTIDTIKTELCRLPLDFCEREYIANCITPLETAMEFVSRTGFELATSVSVLTTSPIVPRKKGKLKDTIHTIYRMNEEVEDLFEVLKPRLRRLTEEDNCCIFL